MTNNLNEFLKSIQATQALTKNFGIALQFSEIHKIQNNWKNSFSGLSMLSDIAKSINRQAMLNKSHLSMIGAI